MNASASRWPLLSRIDSPADLRALAASELGAVCAELRDYLIHTVATRGGHFAAGLGSVELTVALHYLYNTPEDRLVWDVGHQCYPHKILTGRRDRIRTLRNRLEEGNWLLLVEMPSGIEMPWTTLQQAKPKAVVRLND